MLVFDTNTFELVKNRNNFVDINTHTVIRAYKHAHCDDLYAHEYVTYVELMWKTNDTGLY